MCLLLYVTFATAYLLFLAIAYFVIKEPSRGAMITGLTRFAIVVPAHNEELLIARLCESFLKVDYPRELRDVFVIVDNSEDRTAAICAAYPVNVLERTDKSALGKGFALSWGLARTPMDQYQAVLILDADSVVDSQILVELNRLTQRGEQAIQCYNGVGNRSESWFTQILFVSRTVGNLLYHSSKHKLGLSSYLMGNGICFSTTLLRNKGWTAFTIGEDWEYYAQLIQDHIRIGFAAEARLFHQESKSLNQATSQRLRWSRGRFSVARTLGLKLFLRGIRQRDWFTIDASLPLILPNYSLQLNLTLLVLALCFLLPSGTVRGVLTTSGIASLLGQALLFLTGTLLAGGYWDVFKSVLRVPFFLSWKLSIDLLTFTGIYRGDKWVRTRRHQPDENRTVCAKPVEKHT
jgi:1,2-diacylglycerol 3-beta-glucosyltransferase